MHGLVPKMAGNLSSQYISIGAIECGALVPSGLLESKCELTGGIAGGIYPTNLPFIAVGSFINILPAVSAEDALALAGGLFIITALWGGHRLFRYATDSKSLALIMAGLYLLTPVVFGMQGFGGTYWGVLLLPTYIFIAWYLLDKGKSQSNIYHVVKGIPILILAWSLLASFSLLLDGYSFFMYSFVAGTMAISTIRRTKASAIVTSTNLLLIGLSTGVAYVIYTNMLPSGGFDRSAIGLFRAMGLDVATIFIPTMNTWLASVLGVGADWSNLWGDGTNTRNYIGLIILGIATYGLTKLIKQSAITRLHVAMIAVGVIGLLLSLGPTLKINTERPPLTEPITYESYLMKDSEGVLSLPTENIYKLPGFKSMRATYRWFIVTQISVLFFATIGFDYLRKNKKTKLYSLTLLIAVIDVVPVPVATVSNNLNKYDQYGKFNSEVITPLKEVANEGELVLFYPNAIGNNDYLVNYIVPTLKLESYNVGNDKARDNAKRYWPSPIKTLLTTDGLKIENEHRLIQQVFDQDLVDIVIIPGFDLRWDSYSWPPRKFTDSKEELIGRLSNNDHLVITSAEHFTIVRRAED